MNETRIDAIYVSPRAVERRPRKDGRVVGSFELPRFAQLTSGSAYNKWFCLPQCEINE
jgi:hypothetical protein